jgi:hypothetical protein
MRGYLKNSKDIDGIKRGRQRSRGGSSKYGKRRARDASISPPPRKTKGRGKPGRNRGKKGVESVCYSYTERMLTRVIIEKELRRFSKDIKDDLRHGR